MVLENLNTMDVLKECVETLTIQIESDKIYEQEEQRIASTGSEQEQEEQRTGSEQAETTVTFQLLESLELSKDIEQPGKKKRSEN